MPFPDAEAARGLANKSAALSAQLERKRKDKATAGSSSLRVPGRWDGGRFEACALRSWW
jgi:hypothetical protein